MPEVRFRMAKIAICVYPHRLNRLQDDAYDKQKNMGTAVVHDILARAGHEVVYCDASNPEKIPVMLVPFISPYDLYQVYAAGKKAKWAERKFKIIVGGPGLSNIHPIRGMVDYAVFGRVEGFLPDLIEAALTGKPCDNPAVLNLPDLSPVQVGLGHAVYPHSVEYRPCRFWLESSFGCPKRCYFCVPSWTRKFVSAGEEFHGFTLDHGDGGLTQEITVEKMGDQYDPKIPQVTAGVDGWNEQIRFALNKKITDQMIVDGVDICREKTTCKGIVFKFFMVASTPFEAADAYKNMQSVLSRVKNPSGLMSFIQITGLCPAQCTPCEFVPVRLTDWNVFAYKNMAFGSTPQTRVLLSKGSMSEWRHLTQTLAVRVYPGMEKMFDLIATNKSLNNMKNPIKTAFVKKNFPAEIAKITAQIDRPEDSPTWYLTGSTARAKIFARFEKMMKELEA